MKLPLQNLRVYIFFSSILGLLCPTAIYSAPQQPIKAGPIWAASWSNVSQQCENIIPMIWVTETSSPAKIALKSRTKPKGQAVLFLRNWARKLLKYPEDACRTPTGNLTKYPSPWPTTAVSEWKSLTTQFFSDYKHANGRLDLLILDYEGTLANWVLSDQHLLAIQQDPRSNKLKAQLGFRNFLRINRWQKGNKTYLAWNAIMHKQVCQALNKAIFNPVQGFYPTAKSCNYGGYISTQKHAIPDLNGHKQYRIAYCGTHGSRSFYGRINQLAKKKLDNQSEYGQSPFAVLRWHLNSMRAIKRSSNVPFLPWISHKDYHRSAFRDTPYYEELIYHLALSGIDAFLYWNPRAKDKQIRLEQQSVYDADDLLLDRCLKNINAIVQQEPRSCISLDPIPWNQTLLATGMRIGKSRVLWRISTPPGIRRIKVFPTNQIISIDEGMGAWFETQYNAPIAFELIRAHYD